MRRQLLFIPLALLSVGAAFGYSSDILEKKQDQKEIRTYYPRHLGQLRKAVPPRTIRYIDSGNYRNYGKLIVQGILFTYADANAKKIFWVSNRDGFKRHPMWRNSKGVWIYIYEPPPFVQNKPEKKIRYKFLVDGMYEEDRNALAQEEDGAGGVISVFELSDSDLVPVSGVMVQRNKNLSAREVALRIYAPEAKTVAVAGTFNAWNWDYDYLKKGEDGYFELRKYLLPGTYFYKYRVDGVWKIQTFTAGTGRSGKAVLIPDYTIKRHPAFGPVIQLDIR